MKIKGQSFQILKQCVESALEDKSITKDQIKEYADYHGVKKTVWQVYYMTANFYGGGWNLMDKYNVENLNLNLYDSHIESAVKKILSL